jgi:predicted Na+-dependent transporter
MEHLIKEGFVFLLSASTMLSLGLEFNRKPLLDYGKLKFRITLILFLNFAVLPLMGWYLLKFADLSMPLSAGILLCLLSPGGSTAGILNRWAGGDDSVASLVVTLMSIIGIIYIPWIYFKETANFANLSVLAKLFFIITLYQLVPFAVGRWLAINNKTLADKLAPFTSKVATWSFIIFIIIALWLYFDVLLTLKIKILGYITILAIFPFSLGIIMPKGLPGERVAYIFSSGIRNLTIALVLASIGRNSNEVTIAILTYGLIMYLVALPLSIAFGKIQF